MEELRAVSIKLTHLMWNQEMDKKDILFVRDILNDIDKIKNKIKKIKHGKIDNVKEYKKTIEILKTIYKRLFEQYNRSKKENYLKLNENIVKTIDE